MDHFERKQKPDAPPRRPWDYLGWQGEQPTIDDLPGTAKDDHPAGEVVTRPSMFASVNGMQQLADAEAEVERLKRELEAVRESAEYMRRAWYRCWQEKQRLERERALTP